MRFPKRIRYRARVLAIIYGKCKGRDDYRVCWRVAGKRRMAAFPTYTEAKAHAERVVRDLARGSQASALTADQARDALAALERLQGFHQATGHRVSLLSAVSEYCEAAGKLRGVTLGEAVARYLGTVATVQRKDLGQAVEGFIHGEEPRTKAGDGQRAQLSTKYAYNRAIILRRFAGTFQNTAVCDLAKTHLDAFIGSLGDFSAKSRNHHRATAKQFLQWAARKDYLPPTHRLLEADAMRPERANEADIHFYTPREFRSLLEAAAEPMRAMIAIGGLAGLRTIELLRLDWADVWRVPGHIEITAGKAKTRQRRLVEVCPALAAWMEPNRTLKNGKLWTGHEIVFQQQFVKVCERAGVGRKPNGLRHAFCTYHFALHANENLTAAQAGNSPAMVHGHYKGLATRAEAEKWFKVKPAGVAANVVSMPTASRNGV
jgi:integrase